MFHKVYILWQHCARNGLIFNNHSTANLRRNNPAIKIENPIRFNRTMAMNLGGLVFAHPVHQNFYVENRQSSLYTVGYSVLINRRFIHILSPVTKRWQTMLLLNCCRWLFVNFSKWSVQLWVGLSSQFLVTCQHRGSYHNLIKLVVCLHRSFRQVARRP